MWGEITLKDGRVEQRNFNDYRVLRINEAPLIEVHLVKNAEAPGGIGEPGTIGIAPAMANAIFARDRQAHPQAAHQGSIALCIEFGAKAVMPRRHPE